MNGSLFQFTVINVFLPFLKSVAHLLQGYRRVMERRPQLLLLKVQVRMLVMTAP